MINGIINLYKEPGFTSHDVVAKLRGILRQKKIGHTGTLDPEAQGVLPVCLGTATKVCDMLTERDKTYRAVLLLGVETDTQDASGTVLSQGDLRCGAEEVCACIRTFTGRQQQIPPMYSALKVGGKKLCDLARQGIEVERKPREIVISEIVIEKVELPRITMKVTCSKGTYIRTLCHDIGRAAGCGGCMESLTRLRSGSFHLKDSVTLDDVIRLRDADMLQEIVIPVDHVFAGMKALALTVEGTRLAGNGNPFGTEHCTDAVLPENLEEFRVYGADQRFMAVYRWNADRNRFVPVKMFPG